ncbi:MAG: selenoneine biosynthesis selenosugar synthase SenB [Planctomycetota bacterium]|nr:selenoneine biosynthesis selenosugar synthase SenB [Planctomycetota bacterium]
MHLGIVTPASSGSLAGNRITSLRWARMLTELGHEVSLETSWDGQPWDALVALHARRSADSIRRFDDARPDAPLVVALAGTDLYVDLPDDNAEVLESLRRADHILALQSRAKCLLPEDVRARVVVIPQSSEPLDPPTPKREDAFQVAVVGHLRAVKAPLLTAHAARLLPAHSRIEVLHVGGVLDAELGTQADEESRTNPRYTWLGPLAHDETRTLVASSQLLSHTSRSEGGANVISEALVLGTPVVSTRIDGTVGMLGEAYPGYVGVDDAPALAALLRRAEEDATFYATLTAACARRRAAFEPAAERASWAALIDSWRGGPPSRAAPSPTPGMLDPS